MRLELSNFASRMHGIQGFRCMSVVLLLLVLMPVAGAQVAESTSARTDFSSYTQVAVSLSHERLSAGLPDWFSAAVYIDYHPDPRRVVYGYFRQVGRFDQTDSEMSLGTVIPVADNWVASVDAALSPDADILPRNSASIRLAHKLGGGWVTAFSLRRANYASTYSGVASVSVERYIKDYRFVYRVSTGKAEDAERTVTHAIRSDYYYGDRNMVGLSLASGQESESIGLGRLITTDVTAVSLLGEHWFTQRWAVRWRIGRHRQGKLYDRTGVDFALKYRF